MWATGRFSFFGDFTLVHFPKLINALVRYVCCQMSSCLAGCVRLGEIAACSTVYLLALCSALN